MSSAEYTKGEDGGWTTSGRYYWLKELLPLTGYMRGGCSPIGMKKKFPTYIEETAQIFDKISISAGQRGVQVILNPEELAKYVDAQFVALI